MFEEAVTLLAHGDRTPDADVSDSGRNGKSVTVTRSQINAARLNVMFRRDLGMPVPPAMEAIANARPARREKPIVRAS